MKNINTYIIENILINKDTNIKDITYKEICDLINNYYISVLNLSTTKYVIQCEDEDGNICSNDSEKLDHIFLWSKDFINIDKVAEDIKHEINKVKKVKNTKVYATSIYFDF